MIVSFLFFIMFDGANIWNNNEITKKSGRNISKYGCAASIMRQMIIWLGWIALDLEHAVLETV
jgi:hypothetical protein